MPRAVGGFWLAVASCCCVFPGAAIAAESGAQSAGNAGMRSSVILISIDTLRADHLSAYGYRRIRTPNIDSFADSGTLFTAASAQIPLTLPSHTSLFTSTYPFENRIEENEERVPSGAVTLASVLRSHGYKTAAFVGSSLLDRHLGLDQGFDFYDSPFNASTAAQQSPYSVRVRRDGALVVRSALQWLAANRGQPVFVFIHLFDLHTPYSVSGGLWPETVGYDAQLERVDQLLGRLRQGLAEGGWWARSLTVLLSDHGESLGEHGESSHGYFVYQSTLWTALMIHWPEPAAGKPPASSGYPARVDEPAGLIDVAPTILDFLRIPAPSSFEGASLLASPSGKAGGARAVYSESVYTRDNFHWAALRALRKGAFKYIDAPKPELYNIQLDPGEQSNLISKNPAEAAALHGELTRLLARDVSKRPASSRDVSAQTRKLLGSLGYLSGDSRPRLDNSGPDPKDRLPEYQLYEKALTYQYGGHPREAISVYRAILAKDPHNVPARGNLGECYLSSQDVASAVREWTGALAEDPQYAPAAEALAEYWVGRANYDKAAAYFREVLNASPGDYSAWFGLGIAEERLGLWQDALGHLQTACKIDANSARCREELSVVEQKLKQP
jgi:choline-sulfatase